MADVADPVASRGNLGLGTMAVQNANAVNIIGGNITGINDLAIADGGTGASTAPAARNNLGLGTMAIQNDNNVAITGGTINGLAAPLPVDSGGTGLHAVGAVGTALFSTALGTYTHGYADNLGTQVVFLNHGDDLNNFTTPGVYGCANNAIAASLLNAPADLDLFAFQLIVRTPWVDFTRQTIITYPGNVFERQNRGGAWQDWARTRYRKAAFHVWKSDNQAINTGAYNTIQYNSTELLMIRIMDLTLQTGTIQFL